MMKTDEIVSEVLANMRDATDLIPVGGLGKGKRKVTPKVENADVPRILIPNNVSFRDAAKHCTMKAEEAEKVVPFSQTFNCLPWAGSWALEKVLNSKYSATAVNANEINVPSAQGVKKIRWGTWEVAGLGEINQGAELGAAGVNYSLQIMCPRMLGAIAEIVFREVQEEIDQRELYAGTAVMLEPDADGDLFLNSPPQIVKLPDVERGDLVLERSLEASVSAELFLPICHSERIAKSSAECRRGVLLIGRPGTGKTLTARIAAREAVRKGWAAFYLPDARGVENALKIAAGYAPAVLICEDLDRSMGKERDASVDRILNALDGLDRSKQVVFIATTNDSSNLPAPLLRPGRMDSILFFDVPDAEAALRLVRLYMAKDTPEFTEAEERDVGLACSGLLPAAIREIVTRATLHALDNDREVVHASDLVEASVSVRKQQERLEEAENLKRPIPEKRVRIVDETERGVTARQLHEVGRNCVAEEGSLNRKEEHAAR